MSLSVTGKLLHIGDVEVVSDKFSKRTIVLDLSEEYNGTRYDNPVPFVLTQKKLDLSKGFSVGQEVTLQFNLKGRRWEKDGKVSWFGSNEVWRMEAAGSNNNANNNSGNQAAPAYSNNAPANNFSGTANYNPSPETVDDLPF
jgi:hypothetical protein